MISDPERGLTRFDYFLELAHDTWLELVLDQEPGFEPNLPVTVRGERNGSVFHVETIELVASPADEEVGSVQEALIAPTPKRVAVVLFNLQLPDDRSGIE